jgi:hypothetical protein
VTSSASTRPSGQRKSMSYSIGSAVVVDQANLDFGQAEQQQLPGCLLVGPVRFSARHDVGSEAPPGPADACRLLCRSPGEPGCWRDGKLRGAVATRHGLHARQVGGHLRAPPLVRAGVAGSSFVLEWRRGRADGEQEGAAYPPPHADQHRGCAGVGSRPAVSTGPACRNSEHHPRTRLRRSPSSADRDSALDWPTCRVGKIAWFLVAPARAAGSSRWPAGPSAGILWTARWLGSGQPIGVGGSA